MGDLLMFKTGPARKPYAAAPDTLPNLLLFTGVRYERDAEQPPSILPDSKVSATLGGGVDGAGGGRPRRRG